ncbi:serine/threonine-protein phosphatase 6 regulatory ankyrin repeat subunit C-like [Liolophura sinensis]|uniref:serine/threonine-protein phosphatase 6 regulatory ankyrin repeat subunit C-like n=1 Tax=Liolophura sinensis TaxID=3198878 RepID=UPI0031582315
MFDSKSIYHHQNNEDNKTMAKSVSSGKPGRRFDNQISLDRSSQSSQSNLLHYSEKDNHRNICMTFWKPQLSFCPYKYGDKLVDFSSLWPSEQSLRKTMSEVCHDTVLRRAILDMCKMSLRCGPVRLLKALLGLKLVNLDQVFEDGSGMLHLALIARNAEAVQFLCHAGIPPKIRDKYGHPADQVCFSAQLRKLLPQRYIISNSSQSPRYSKSHILPTQTDVESIFNLAQSSKHFDELQKKLQTYEFDVNGQCDSKGDYLVHIATRGGLSMLPMLLTLVRVQGADIDLCNSAGMTPLMIAAQNRDAVLCDVLLCVFGCNPNKPNPSLGTYALHCACVSNCSEAVNVLLNRGADFNLEDLDGRRPDDTTRTQDAEECRAILRSKRIQRSEYLSGLIEKGVPFESEVRYTDLCVVDELGRTLVMVAAENNRVDHLEKLLAVEGSPIDAQHEKTGQTALSVAARAGNMETVRVLLSRDANPGIPDLHGYLPLHYAVMNGHGDVLEAMLEFFPKTYTGLHLASKLAVNTAVHDRIKAAIQKRKEEILTPELYDCALTGDGERLFRVLEDGDNVNLKREVAPLYLAVENGHLDVIKLLYERGGDITRRHPVTQSTVLHAAAKMGHSQVVEFLLQFCRPVTSPVYTLLSKQKDKKFSYMPYQCLKHSYYKELDINALDGDGKTPLQLAADKGYRTIVKLLLDQDATTALLGEQGELIKCPEYEGVRIMIESYREHHTSQVMKWILDRKGLNSLKQIWLPRFDHNLRDPLGNTPLMVACKTGRMDVVRFLLESAVYTTVPSEDNVSEDSDTDSGLERTSNRTPSLYKRGEIGEDVSCPDSQSSRFAISVLLQPIRGTSLHPGNSLAPTPTTQVQRPNSTQFGQPAVSLRRSPSWTTLNLEDLTFLPQRPDREHNFLMSLPATLVRSESDSLTSNTKYVMTKLMTDLRRPKGLQIFHDNKVCHVCAVNLLDGNTALHRTIEGGDNLQVAQLLLQHDPAVAHTQNFQGYSPLHFACKFGRKKIVQMLLSLPDIDVHCLTADGQQPEDLCSSKAVRKLLVKARTENPQPEMSESPVRSLYTSSYNDDTATTINLDKIRDKYQELKRGLHKDDDLL